MKIELKIKLQKTKFMEVDDRGTEETRYRSHKYGGSNNKIKENIQAANKR